MFTRLYLLRQESRLELKNFQDHEEKGNGISLHQGNQDRLFKRKCKILKDKDQVLIFFVYLDIQQSLSKVFQMDYSLETPYQELFKRSIWMFYFKCPQRLKMSAVNIQFNSFIFVYLNLLFFVCSFFLLSSLSHWQPFVFFSRSLLSMAHFR